MLGKVKKSSRLYASVSIKGKYMQWVERFVMVFSCQENSVTKERIGYFKYIYNNNVYYSNAVQSFALSTKGFFSLIIPVELVSSPYQNNNITFHAIQNQFENTRNNRKWYSFNPTLVPSEIWIHQKSLFSYIYEMASQILMNYKRVSCMQI